MTERITNPQELPPYDFLMERVTQEGAVSQKQVEALMAMIAYHETGPNQRNLPEAIQETPVPYGRGLYQYEMALGRDIERSGSRTAMNRLYAALGGDLSTGKKPSNMPKWMNKYFSENKWGHLEASGEVDFSELNEEQQKTLFLADKLMEYSRPGRDQYKNLKAIGVESDSTWWQQYHQKGGGSTAKFDSSRSSFLNNRISQ